MAKHVFVVLTNPTAGREDEYNAWYNGTHVPEVLASPGITAAQRFKLSVAGGGAFEPHRYLCIYECEAEDVATVHETLLKRFSAGQITVSDALDANSAYAAYYTPIMDRVQK